MYGYLKQLFERYLESSSEPGAMQMIALRLEYPGVRSVVPWNFYVSTSVENLVAGFRRALEAPPSFCFEAFNLADGDVDAGIVDIQEFVRRQWPSVPNHSSGNESLLGIEKARQLLGYRPVPGGHYYDHTVMW
jgi:nucleoside-diphosphate-sugar epimerase